MTPRFDTYVAVFFEDDHGMTITKFVTSAERNTAHWEAGKEAHPFAESYAKDIVFGLTLNGYAAAVIKVLHGVELRNRPAEMPQ